MLTKLLAYGYTKKVVENFLILRHVLSYGLIQIDKVIIIEQIEKEAIYCNVFNLFTTKL